MMMMMEEDHDDQRFVCKLCNKKYPCGKSLGGHMRSHVIANSAEESDEKGEIFMSKDSKFAAADFANGQSSYTLRENPRKTWRAVADSRAPLPLEKVCKQCGKGFQSLKALCGHMACHSEKDKGLKDDHSWTSDKLVLDSHSDTEEGDEERVRTRSSKSKKYKKVVLMKSSSFSLANNGSSSVSEIDGQDQEEVAMCLMLLSRDSLNHGGFYSVLESSDNNSVVLETKSSSIETRVGEKEGLNGLHGQEIKKVEDMKLKGSVLDDEIAQVEDSDSGYFLDECAKAESEVSFEGSRRNFSFSEKLRTYREEFRKFSAENVVFDDDDDIMASNFGCESRKRKCATSEVLDESPEKRSKYECFNCKKTFKSYQALGGHRPCHKRNNVVYESTQESGENVLEDSTDFRANRKLVESRKSITSSADKKVKPKKHICPFCDRVFKNGQALGGHKRSHFLGGGNGENSNQRPVVEPVTMPVVEPESPDLLDLNLPAPEADEDDGFFSW